MANQVIQSLEIVIDQRQAWDEDKRHKGIFGAKKDGVDKDVMATRRVLLDTWYQAWSEFAHSLNTRDTLHSWKLFETAVAEVRTVRKRDIAAALAKLNKQSQNENTMETANEHEITEETSDE